MSRGIFVIKKEDKPPLEKTQFEEWIPMKNIILLQTPHKLVIFLGGHLTLILSQIVTEFQFKSIWLLFFNLVTPASHYLIV